MERNSFLFFALFSRSLHMYTYASLLVLSLSLSLPLLILSRLIPGRIACRLRSTGRRRAAYSRERRRIWRRERRRPSFRSMSKKCDTYISLFIFSLHLSSQGLLIKKFGCITLIRTCHSAMTVSLKLKIISCINLSVKDFQGFTIFILLFFFNSYEIKLSSSSRSFFKKI